MRQRLAARGTFFDLDELNDASQILEMKMDDAEKLLTREMGVFKKFKFLVPKVENVTRAIEDAARKVTDMRDNIREKMRAMGSVDKQTLTGEGVMNVEMAASEIVKVAKELIGDSGEFTIKRAIKFKPEGSTINSLANARMIKDAGYRLVGGYFTYDTNKVNYTTTAFFLRGEEHQEHVFTGFSIGYGGEGPHGMMEFGEMFGWNFSKENVFGRALVDERDPGSVQLRDL